MICHKEKDLLACGYTYAGVSYPDMPGYGAIRKAAIKLDAPIENLQALRISEFDWQVWFCPGTADIKGFVDRALLP